MTELNQLTGAAALVAIGPRTYRLKPLVLADYGEIENLILAARPDPLGGITERLAHRPESEQRAELAALQDRIVEANQVTLADFDSWWKSPGTYSYRVWMMLRKEHPAMTVDAVRSLLARATRAERAALAAAVNRCHGRPNHLGATSMAEPNEPLAWHRWAVELSRAYGWTPGEIGQLTVAQLRIYLSQARDSGSRRRVSRSEGEALCQERQAERQQWIERMLQEINHAA